MEFRGNESPASSAEKIKNLETQLEILGSQKRNLMSGKNKEGYALNTKADKLKAKQDKKDVNREITRLTNELNVELIRSGESPKKHAKDEETKQEKPQVKESTIETKGESFETGAEYFGSNMEDINLVADTILNKTDKTVEKLNSEGSQNIQTLEKAKATEKELEGAKKDQNGIINAGKSEAEKLKGELFELTFPEMTAVDGLDNKQLEAKLNEVDNFLRINKIDLAFEIDQEDKSDIENKYSENIVAIGAYRKELVQKKLDIDNNGTNEKSPIEKPAIPKHIELDLKNNDNLETFKPLLEAGEHRDIVTEIMKLAGLKPEEFENFDYRVDSNKDRSTAKILFGKKDSMDTEFTIAVDLNGGKIEKISKEDRLRMFNDLISGFAHRGDLIKQRSSAKDKEEVKRIDAELFTVNSELDSLYKKLDRPEAMDEFDDSKQEKIKKIGEILRSARITDSFDYMSGTGSADLIEDTIRKRGGFKSPEPLKTDTKNPISKINNKKMEKIPIEPIADTEPTANISSIDIFDFENIRDKEDLSNRLFEFGKILEENNLQTEREISTDLLLFLENKSLGHLESAKMQIDKCKNENAKNKLQELIVKCEAIPKDEPKPIEDNKAEKEASLKELKSKLIALSEGDYDTFRNRMDDNQDDQIIKDRYDEGGFNILIKDIDFEKIKMLTIGDVKGAIEDIDMEKKNAKERWNSLKDFFIDAGKNIEGLINDPDTKDDRRNELIQLLSDRTKTLGPTDLEHFNIEKNPENESRALEIQTEIFSALFEKYKDTQKAENGDTFGIEIKTAEEVGKMTNDELMSAGAEAFAKYEEIESDKDFETLKATNEFLAFAEYLNILSSEHDNRVREGKIEIKKHKIASNEEIKALDMKSLQEELSRTEIYLNYIKINKSQEDWFSSEFSDYGLYQQKLVDRIKEINENPGATPAESPKETASETAGIETMSDEDIKKETDTDALQEKIDETIDYLKNTENISEEIHSRLSIYIDNLQIRKSELEKILISEGYKKINTGIKDLNKNIIQIERTSETQEIENIKNAKTIKELSDGIMNIETKGFDGKDIANIKTLKNVLENIFSQVADEKGGKLKNDVNMPDFRNMVTDSAKDATAKSYIVALFAAIENIKTEHRIEISVGDKVRMKEKDGQVRDGWIVTKIDGKNAEVQNDKSGEVLETTLGELAGWQDDKLMEEAKRIKDKEEEIKLREYELQLNGTEAEKDEKLNKLKNELKELKGVKTEKGEKKEAPQTYGEIVENMKKMGEFLEKRKIELSRINSDEQIQKIKDKVSRGEKLSEKETSQYKSMFMAKDEVTIAEIGISAIQNADLYKIDLPSLSHEEAMKVLDRRIKASKIDILLHETLRSSIRSCNEKIYQMDSGRRGAAGAIVDGILRAAKHIPIIKNLTYVKLETKTEQQKKKEEDIKEGAFVGIKEKKGISEKWKVVKIEGNKVRIEKESRAVKEFKEKDLMKWNSITEKGKFKKGDKVRVMVDGKIETDWVIENVEDNKILAANDKAKTEKTVKKEDIVSVQEKTENKQSPKDLMKELNGLKNSDLNLANIKDMASFDKASKALKTKFSEMSQKTSYFEGLEDKAKNDIQNVFNIDLNWYNECVRKKRTEEKMKDREQDKKGFNDNVEKHKNLIKNLPDELKDFKESLEKFIDFASYVYHETKYSDEPDENENEKEEKALLKKIFARKEIKAIKDSENANELIEAIEKLKTDIKSQIKDHKAIESSYLILDNIASDSKTNKRIRGYTRDKLRDEIEKTEDDSAKKYLKAVLEKIDDLITSKKDAVGNEPKKKPKNKSKTGKK